MDLAIIRSKKLTSNLFDFVFCVFFFTMQKLQSELKVRIKIASQATPSPRAKATMETLDRTKADLILNYDSVVQSLKQLNRMSRERNGNANNNGDTIINDISSGENPAENTVHKQVLRASVDRNESQKKGECPIAQFTLSVTVTVSLHARIEVDFFREVTEFV